MDAPCVPRLRASFPARAFFWVGVVEKEEPDYLCGPLWPVRLGVRTPGFHPGSRGSNPLRATSKKAPNRVPFLRSDRHGKLALR